MPSLKPPRVVEGQQVPGAGLRIDTVNRYLPLLGWLGLSSLGVVVQKFTGLPTSWKVAIALAPAAVIIVVLWRKLTLARREREPADLVESIGTYYPPAEAVEVSIGPGNADFVTINEKFVELILPLKIVNCAPFEVTVVDLDLQWEVTADAGRKVITSGRRSKRYSERLWPGRRFKPYDYSSKKEPIEATCANQAGTLGIRGRVLVASDYWDGEQPVQVTECIRVAIVNNQRPRDDASQS